MKKLKSVLIAACLALPSAQADQARDMVVSAQMDNASNIRRLIGKGGSPNTVDPTTGETLLMIALREEANKVVGELLAQPNIDLEQKAPNGNTALMLAAFKRNKPAVVAMIAKGAIVTRPGWTALHYAAASGDTGIAAILLEHSAYIDAESPSKLTPLMIAGREGHAAVAQLLLREGADATLTNNERLTAQQIALRAGHTEIAGIIARHLAAR
ncbi:ankyrin repeat domain-containing protein [Massilia sp. PAMC28688]|uniref:ankyrin repeat domain-containing protein n=1 Tax=Massilia sp. PAMC28688 TaxID=2861283 RepID=UPI001C62A8B0|nr:ankyrin repeat domain-containing protein [Massilia sp. PAMC28688]QYF93128.1 ankyrin repeat domain-containing protein [Massilia sp. PAMC28688]